MMFRKLSHAFLLATPIAFGSIGISGCATNRHVVHEESCTMWKEGGLQSPLMIGFSFKTAAENDLSCLEGRKIAYSALLGRSTDGRFNPAALVMWNRLYTEVGKDILNLRRDLEEITAQTSPIGQGPETERIREELERKERTKKTADRFIMALTSGSITSETLKEMVREGKTTPPGYRTGDPSGHSTGHPLGNSGTKKPVCTGDGVIVHCK